MAFNPFAGLQSSVSSALAPVTQAVQMGRSALEGVVSQAQSLITPNILAGLSAGVAGPLQGALPLGLGGPKKMPGAGAAAQTDLRVRLSPLRGQEDQIYGKDVAPSDVQFDLDSPNLLGNILTPLRSTNGLVFPYTPTLTLTQNVEYTALSLVHSNQDWYAYARTPSVEVSITGEFTVQNQRDGEYALAALHFLRTVSKMHFGEQDENAGLPPPVLQLNGYGAYMFNKLPVIVKSHNYTLDKNVDGVTINTQSGQARLPAVFTLAVTLIVQNTPRRQRQEFNLEDFRTGKAMVNPGGWL